MGSFLIGFLIVIAVLACLALAVRGGGAPDAKAPEQSVPAVPVQEPLLAETPAAPAEEIPGEVAAAIAAAVYLMFPSGKVTSIRRAAQPARSAWGFAGLLENTRPF